MQSLFTLKSKTLNLLSLAMAVSFFMIITSCSKENISTEVADIDEYIKNLDYDQSEILNLNNTPSGNSNRTELRNETVESSPNKGKYTSCEEVEFKLERNIDKVSILRPTNGVIWPGALIYGDEDMLKGTPRPIALDRGTMKLRLDLPGMEEEGTIEIDAPENTKVQSEINKALEWWNENEYQEGYVNPSLSEYTSSVSYSSSQLALDLGISGQWVSGSVESQLNVATNTEREVATMIFRQVFYSLTMNTPSSPGAVFGSDVTLEEVKANINNSTPPAYVRSVDYGRIIMFRIETNKSSSDVQLDAVLEYATGVNSATANASFDQVLNNSSTKINVITIGGNAEVTSEAITAVGQGSLAHILTGKSAVYSRDNPGLPIGYTIQYLRDNSFAKMGFSTDYTISECSVKEWNHRQVTIKNEFKQKNIRVKLKYTDKSGNKKETAWETIKDETYEGEDLKDIPNGAYDVTLNVEKYEFLDGWDKWKTKTLGHIDDNDNCWRAFGTGSNRKFEKCN